MPSIFILFSSEILSPSCEELRDFLPHPCGGSAPRCCLLRNVEAEEKQQLIVVPQDRLGYN